MDPAVMMRARSPTGEGLQSATSTPVFRFPTEWSRGAGASRIVAATRNTSMIPVKDRNVKVLQYATPMGWHHRRKRCLRATAYAGAPTS